MGRELTIIKHYETDDHDCNQGYCSVEILDSEGSTIAIYGTEHYDRGEHRAAGFVDGVRLADGVVPKLKFRYIPDGKVGEEE